MLSFWPFYVLLSADIFSVILLLSFWPFYNTHGKLFETLKQNNTTTVHETSNKPLLLGERKETRTENLRKRNFLYYLKFSCTWRACVGDLAFSTAKKNIPQSALFNRCPYFVCWHVGIDTFILIFQKKEALCWGLFFSNAEKNIPQQSKSPMNSFSRTQFNKPNNQEHNTQGKLFETLKQNNTTTVHETSNKPLLLGERKETRKENLRKEVFYIIWTSLLKKSLCWGLCFFND